MELERGEICSRGSPRPGALRVCVLLVRRSCRKSFLACTDITEPFASGCCGLFLHAASDRKDGILYKAI